MKKKRAGIVRFRFAPLWFALLGFALLRIARLWMVQMRIVRMRTVTMRMLTFICLCFFLLGAASLPAGKLPGDHWELLTVAYPPDRDISVVLGGAEKTLTTKGICKVKWQNGSASIEIKVENLPAASEIDWAGRRYVLWAIDSEKRSVNLGPVPLNKKNAKWKVQAPFRVFGLLVTAEQNPSAEAPSGAVVMESLLPTDPRLVLPVFRVDVPLVPGQS